jgi:hypothetical protein
VSVVSSVGAAPPKDSWLLCELLLGLGAATATYGLLVCLPSRLVLVLCERGMLLLALEPALRDKLEGLSPVTIEWLKELLLRSWLDRAPSSLLAKNEAFEAVIGVVGVLLLPNFGGGVMILSPDSVAGARALTRATVGVLKGGKFSGGSLRGAKSFFLKLEEEVLLSNVGKPKLPPGTPTPDPRVIPRFLLLAFSASVFTGL